MSVGTDEFVRMLCRLDAILANADDGEVSTYSGRPTCLPDGSVQFWSSQIDPQLPKNAGFSEKAMRRTVATLGVIDQVKRFEGKDYRRYTADPETIAMIRKIRSALVPIID